MTSYRASNGKAVEELVDSYNEIRTSKPAASKRITKREAIKELSGKYNLSQCGVGAILSYAGESGVHVYSRKGFYGSFKREEVSEGLSDMLSKGLSLGQVANEFGVSRKFASSVISNYSKDNQNYSSLKRGVIIQMPLPGRVLRRAVGSNLTSDPLALDVSSQAGDKEFVIPGVSDCWLSYYNAGDISKIARGAGSRTKEELEDKLAAKAYRDAKAQLTQLEAQGYPLPKRLSALTDLLQRLPEDARLSELRNEITTLGARYSAEIAARTGKRVAKNLHKASAAAEKVLKAGAPAQQLSAKAAREAADVFGPTDEEMAEAYAANREFNSEIAVAYQLNDAFDRDKARARETPVVIVDSAAEKVAAANLSKASAEAAKALNQPTDADLTEADAENARIDAERNIPVVMTAEQARARASASSEERALGVYARQLSIIQGDPDLSGKDKLSMLEEMLNNMEKESVDNLSEREHNLMTGAIDGYYSALAGSETQQIAAELPDVPDAPMAPGAKKKSLLARVRDKLRNTGVYAAQKGKHAAVATRDWYESNVVTGTALGILTVVVGLVGFYTWRASKDVEEIAKVPAVARHIYNIKEYNAVLNLQKEQGKQIEQYGRDISYLRGKADGLEGRLAANEGAVNGLRTDVQGLPKKIGEEFGKVVAAYRSTDAAEYAKLGNELAGLRNDMKNYGVKTTTPVSVPTPIPEADNTKKLLEDTTKELNKVCEAIGNGPGSIEAAVYRKMIAVSLTDNERLERTMLAIEGLKKTRAEVRALDQIEAEAATN